MNLKKCIFIGNRATVFENLLLTFGNQLEVIKLFVLEDSMLDKTDFQHKDVEIVRFGLKDKKKIISFLREADYDVLISNGCPFILPISSFKKDRDYLNIHPTYLPYLKGKTPINGVFYNSMDFFGATMHFMDDGIDTGPVLAQEKITLSQDIDLPMLYYMSFRLEGEVAKKGLSKLLSGQVINVSGTEKGSYFNRLPEMQSIDFTESTEEIFKRIQSFGISSQGVSTQLNGQNIRLFKAEIILNEKFHDWFTQEAAGKLLLTLDDQLYIKTIDGIIRVTKYSWENEL